MKSKLLQKKSYGVSQSRAVVDGQQENIEDSSVPWTHTKPHTTHTTQSTWQLTPRPASQTQVSARRQP
jgi:hypothetical protein